MVRRGAVVDCVVTYPRTGPKTWKLTQALTATGVAPTPGPRRPQSRHRHRRRGKAQWTGAFRRRFWMFARRRVEPAFMSRVDEPHEPVPVEAEFPHRGTYGPDAARSTSPPSQGEETGACPKKNQPHHDSDGVALYNRLYSSKRGCNACPLTV